MSRSAAVYVDGKRDYAVHLCEAWCRGLAQNGVRAVQRPSSAWRGEVEADTAVFYGLRPPFDAILRTYRRDGKTCILMDRGYWMRGPRRNRLGAYYKVTVNSHHPTSYFRAGLGPARFRSLGIEIKPFRRRGSRIVIAGMSGPSAAFHGEAPEAWETRAVAMLNARTDRTIVYRPKPRWKGAGTIPGTVRHTEGRTIVPHLDDAWAVVTHHSNAAIDAAVHGVPFYAEDGPLSVLSPARMTDVLHPEPPQGIEQALWDLAFCQWTASEIGAGACWRHLADQGLV